MYRARFVESPSGAPAGRVWPERFDMLTAWRGIAATMVVVQHVGTGPDFGRYAVMLFFVISGYCISAASESCVRRGLSFGRFMWRRVRRIYPPYLFSILFLYARCKIAGFRNPLGATVIFPRPLSDWIQNLTLTQWLTLLIHPLSRPWQNPKLFVLPFWTLCYEEQFYLIMGLLILIAGWVRRRNAVVLLMLVALGWNLIHMDVTYGIFLDYWVHFGLGVLLFYRLCRMQNVLLRRATDTGLVLMIVTTALLAWLKPPAIPDARPVFAELLTASAFAMLLLLTRPLDQRFKALRFSPALINLGLISYSLYLIHFVNLNAVRIVTLHLLPRWSPRVVVYAVQIAFHIGIATVFWYFCERPFLNPSIVSTQPRPVPPGDVDRPE